MYTQVYTIVYTNTSYVEQATGWLDYSGSDDSW